MTEVASVAHDLRTPLTALNGHLEARASKATPDAARGAAVLQAALAHSRKVSRLSQQLFQLAALQSNAQVLHRERSSLDGVVTDAVQTFGLHAVQPPVTLQGLPPVRQPVRVSLRRDGTQAEIVVEDGGPALPLAAQAAMGL